MGVLTSPYLLGFEDVERLLERLTKSGADGYPPYNIERVPGPEGGSDGLRITLAVAGFTKDDLEVLVEESQLIIRGKQIDDQSRTFLHRGIAARQFQRVFVIADGIEIVSANLQDGLLSVDLIRPEPERVARRIEIKS